MPYDLYASDQNNRGTIPFAVNWPTDPTEDTTVTATTASDLQTQLNSGLRRINYSGVDTTTTVTVGANDCHVHFLNGSRVGGITVPNGRLRAKFSAQTPRNNIHFGSVSVGDGATDIMFDGVRGDGAGSQVDLYNFTRLAIINCELRYGGNYVIGSWNLSADSSSAAVKSDFILANTLLDAASWGSLRIQGTDRAIIVDVLGDTRDSGYASLRLEFNTLNVWIREFYGFAGGVTLDPQVGNSRPNATVHDVKYFDGGIWNDGTVNTGLISFDGPDIANSSKVYNIELGAFDFYSDAYTPGADIGGVQYSSSVWTVNSSQYRDFVSYPTWSFR